MTDGYRIFLGRRSIAEIEALRPDQQARVWHLMSSWRSLEVRRAIRNTLINCP